MDSNLITQKEVQWTPKQRRTLDAVLEGRNVFVTGSAGTGKSRVLSHVKDVLSGCSDKRNYQVIATTGIAALAVEGCTLHHFVGLGLAEEPLNQLIGKSLRFHKEKWATTQVLIIDEISMCHPEFFSNIDAIARACRPEGSSQPFGGIQLVVFGDFAQLPPVHKVRPLAGQPEYCFQTEAWKAANFETIYLEEVFRQEDAQFVATLNRIRMGELSGEDVSVLKPCIDRKLDASDGILPTRLYSRHLDVDSINQAELKRLTGSEVTFQAVTEVLTSGIASRRANEQLQSAKNRLLTDAPAPHQLGLKIDAQVVAVKNDPFGRFVNGSRGVVVSFDQGPDRHPIVQFIQGTVIICPLHWVSKVPSVGSVSYAQVPLCLAWALTIHRAQGMSLDRVEISMEGIFEYGQGYVALSRARSLEGLWILNFNRSLIKAHPRVIEFYLQAKESEQGGCQVRTSLKRPRDDSTSEPPSNTKVKKDEGRASPIQGNDVWFMTYESYKM